MPWLQRGGKEAPGDGFDAPRPRSSGAPLARARYTGQVHQALRDHVTSEHEYVATVTVVAVEVMVGALGFWCGLRCLVRVHVSALHCGV